MPLRTVRVEWIDAENHSDTWATESEVSEFAAKDCLIVSVGFLVSDTTKYITLSGDWDEADRNWSRVTKIPRAWVQKMEDLSISVGATEDVK